MFAAATRNAKTKRNGLRSKMLRVFAVQVLLISLATLVGIFVTNSLVQDVLMRSALDGEAQHFWSLYDADQNHPLPNTDNMQGYMAIDGNYSGVPIAVANVGGEPGYHRRAFDGQEQIVHVSDRGNARLFLVFASDRVTNLALYFGILPLAFVLLVIYGLMFIAFRMSQQAISPIVQLANYLEEFRVGEDHHRVLELKPMRAQEDMEVAAMLDALDHFTQRVDAFIERERVFTRDASHELRTPVAVFKATLDLLEKNADRPPGEKAALARMRRTVTEMESLIETLLLLASENMPEMEVVSVNEVLHREIDQLAALAGSSGTRLDLAEQNDLSVHAPKQVVQMLLSNLLRNAVAYTPGGEIRVAVEDHAVTIADTGVGMTRGEVESAFEPFFRGENARVHKKGHGLGLSIVKRMVDRFGWEIDLQSELGEGTTVRVAFSAS